MSRHRDPERDHDNYISVFLNADNGGGKGNWQAIGYFKNQHVAAFGWSAQEALDKALADYAEPVAEDDGRDLV